MYGKSTVEARDCCANYWLGDDGVRYNTSVLDMQGTKYSDFNSSVTLCRFQASADFNLLSLLSKPTRWSLGVAPAVSVISSSHKLSCGDGSSSTVNFGIGASLRAGYQISDNLLLSLYSGVTHALGDCIDGIEQYNHSANLIWETGAKLSWTFNTAKQ